MSTQSDFSVTPEGEQVYVGSASPESLKETSLQEVHDKTLEFHQKLHDKEKKIGNNFIVGLVPVVGPGIKAMVEQDTALTALTQGVDLDTGKKFTTMSERMKFVAKHEGKFLWNGALATLDVGLWAIGAGEIQALAKVAKGAETAGKIGKGLHVIQEGGKAVGIIEKVGTKATERMSTKAVGMGMEAFATARKIRKAGDLMHGAEFGYGVLSTGKHIVDMTKDPDAHGILSAHNAEWEAMMANPETRKAIEEAYETSDFKNLVDQEYTRMQEDPAYAQEVLDQINAWEANYKEANAQFEQQRSQKTPA